MQIEFFYFENTYISKGVLKYSEADDSKTLKTIDVENNFVKSSQTTSTKARKNERGGWRKTNMQCVQQCSTWSRFFCPVTHAAAVEFNISCTGVHSAAFRHWSHWTPAASSFQLLLYKTKIHIIIIYILTRS